MASVPGFRGGITVMAVMVVTLLWALFVTRAPATQLTQVPSAHTEEVILFHARQVANSSSGAQDIPDYLSMSDEELMEGTDKPGSYYPALHPCPVACATAPTEPFNWTTYTSMEELAICKEPLLFDFNIYNPVADPTSPTKLRVCSLGAGHSTTSVVRKRVQAGIRTKRQTLAGNACAESAVQTTVTMQLATDGAPIGTVTGITAALEALGQHFASDCKAPLMFSHVDGVIAGLYIGSGFGHGAVSSAIEAVVKHVKAGGGSTETTLLQLCGAGRPATHTFGMAVSASGDIATVQSALQSWNQSACATGFGATSELKELKIWQSSYGSNNFTSPGNGTFTNGTATNSTILSRFARSAGRSMLTAREALQVRDDGKNIGRRGLCKLETIVAQDSCGSLAKRCGISASDFTKFNPDKDLCSTLMPGAYVCCSAGGMDDLIPKAGADGVCATYHVVSGDNCNSIAGKHGIKGTDIEKWNKGKTWGWYGCDRLLLDTNICLSEGKRPMPYPNKDALCGPTKPGTPSDYVEDDEQLTNMNKCPLNACCNVWGQCGINGNFCTSKKSEMGNPGTSALNDGCVSSCGSKIVNNGAGPAVFQRVGYYESWNFNRKCLHMKASRASNTGGKGDPYTHVHWAFMGVNTADWSPKIDDPYKQWDDFKKLKVKRIISFGGWGFSTEPATYDILRQAMSPANRNAFATNVAKFVNDQGLDGADFDWEYPGAIDIPGTPPGNPDDGPNYLKFLTVMRQKLTGKSLSIAAPASYWYLKAFPIDKMAKLLDYIVYMTYDLHGQWDAGNKYSIEGCPAGDCLRSHVNLTETLISLSMITKAGVNTNIIFVGESSYGRSFKMSQAGCKGPMCTFTGDRLNSNAAKGKCTDTAGYISNAEIYEIIRAKEVSVDGWFDIESDSDMLVYDQTEWVAYMSETTKNRRRGTWAKEKFAGTIDWALDLQDFNDDDFDNATVVYLGPGVFTGTPAQCTAPCIFVLPPSALPSATTISVPPYTTSLELKPGTTATITVTMPAITTNSMPFSNVNVTLGRPTGPFRPTYSIDLKPITTTITGPGGITQTRTITVPPWPDMTSGPPNSWSSSRDPWQTNPGGGTSFPPPPDYPTSPTFPPVTDVTTLPPGFLPGTATVTTAFTTVVVGPTTKIITPPRTMSIITANCANPLTLNGGTYSLFCQGSTTFGFVCPPTQVRTITASTTTTVSIGCTALVGTRTAIGPGPTEWPDWELLPVPEDIDDDGEDDDGDGPKHKNSCKLWFFSVCIKWEGITIGGWEWNLPSGVWGPGPPPIGKIKLPPNIRIEGNLPPWPRITIGRGGKPTFPPKPANCEPTTASLCITTSSYGTTVDGGSTKTTATRILSTCATIGGCNVEDVETTTTAAACTMTGAPLAKRDPSWWNCEGNNYPDGIILPKIPWDQARVQRIRDILAERKRSLPDQNTDWEEFTAVFLPPAGFTAFFYVYNLGPQAIYHMRNDMKDEIQRVYRYRRDLQRRTRGDDPNADPEVKRWLNETMGSAPIVGKREVKEVTNKNWHLSQVSFPGDLAFNKEDGKHKPASDQWTQFYDDSLGQGQTIYVLDDGFQQSAEFPGTIESIPARRYGPVPLRDEIKDHGTIVAAFAGGSSIGLAKKATIVHIQTPDEVNVNWPIERWLEALVTAANHMHDKPKDTTIVNMSTGINRKWADDSTWEIMMYLMRAMERVHGTVFCIAAGNDGEEVYDMPAIFNSAGALPNMIVVGGVDKNGKRWEGSNHGSFVSVWAPAVNLPYPIGYDFPQSPNGAQGTSLATPIVAGLVAYMRGYKAMGVTSPGSVKAKLMELSREIKLEPNVGGETKRVVWNGQDKLKDCSSGKTKRGLLGRLIDTVLRRQNDDACPLPGGGGGGGPNGPGTGPAITFKPGPPGPTCTTNCGKLCTGAFCNPTPTTNPPDFFPPTTTDKPPDTTDPPDTTKPPNNDPTPTVPAGFPQPNQPDDFRVDCFTSLCGLTEKAQLDVCDDVAKKMLDDSVEFGTGDGQLYSMCKDTTNSKGETVGCLLNFVLEDDPEGAECVWKASEAAQWYSNLRSTCSTCGAAIDTVSFCTLQLVGIGTCKDLTARGVEEGVVLREIAR